MKRKTLLLLLAAASLSVFARAVLGPAETERILSALPPGRITLPATLGLFGLLLLVKSLLWHSELRRAIAPLADNEITPLRYPSISVIRPVRGKDVGAAENFTAALDTGYPGEVETLFVFDDDKDPGLPVAREVVARHAASGRPGRAVVIVAGSPPPGRTGKLNAMSVGARAARGELIAFGDSDTRPDRLVLRRTVETLLASKGAGSAFAPILVHQPPRAAGDALYALMQNALYAPLAAFASGERRELPFIMGQIMVFRREALKAIGGVESVQGQLVDDMAIGKRVHEHGFKNVMSRSPLHIATGGLTLRKFLPIFRRWMYFSRNGLPGSFVWRQWLQGAEWFVAFGTLVATLVTGHFLAALLPLAAMVAQTASLIALNRRYGGAPIPARLWWAAAAFYFVSPVVLVQNMLKKRVEWRGREYKLNTAAALVAPAPVMQQQLAA